jgi:hypothetical protein
MECPGEVGDSDVTGRTDYLRLTRGAISFSFGKYVR